MPQTQGDPPDLGQVPSWLMPPHPHEGNLELLLRCLPARQSVQVPRTARISPRQASAAAILRTPKTADRPRCSIQSRLRILSPTIHRRPCETHRAKSAQSARLPKPEDEPDCHTPPRLKETGSPVFCQSV